MEGNKTAPYTNMRVGTLQTVTRTMGTSTEAYKLASAELKRRGERVLTGTSTKRGGA